MNKMGCRKDTMNDGTDDYYYLHDHLYSPVALLDDTGAVVERCEYDAYGINPAGGEINASIPGSMATITYYDFAYYEKGSKRYNLTRGMTIEELKEFLWHVNVKGGCKCKKKFGVQ